MYLDTIVFYVQSVLGVGVYIYRWSLIVMFWIAFADEITVNITELTDQLASVSLSTVDGQPFIAESTTTTTQASPARPSTQPVLNYTPQAINVEEWPGYLTVEVSQEEFYVQKTGDTELLEQVTQSVAEQGESNSVITDPAVGQACIAKFRDDGLWYRAEIKSVSADSALVMFVDFGNCSDVDRSEIREIDAALAKTPAIAVPCRLSAEAPGQNLTDWAQGRKLYYNHHPPGLLAISFVCVN